MTWGADHVRSLKCGGVDVYVDSYYTRGTGSTFIGGNFSLDSAIDYARRSLELLWGPNRHSVVVPPKVTAGGRIPQRTLMMWLHSDERPMEHPGDDGSHLFLIWFADDDPIDALQDAVRHLDGMGGWWPHAKGYVL